MTRVFRTSLGAVVAAALLVLPTACTDESRYDQAICVLIDTAPVTSRDMFT